MFVMSNFFGCYSFTGGSIPDYIKTLYISTVTDNSGYGNPKYREEFMRTLVETFRKDNSLNLVEKGGDAKLYVVISAIRDEISKIKPGELETQRKITVVCDAEYYDAVKKKAFWKKSFSNFNIYDLTNVQVNRDQAVSDALKRTADDILIAVVSGW